MKCKFCGSEELGKAGRYKTPRGVFQLHKCKKCYRTNIGDKIEEVGKVGEGNKT